VLLDISIIGKLTSFSLGTDKANFFKDAISDLENQKKITTDPNVLSGIIDTFPSRSNKNISFTNPFIRYINHW